MTLKAFHATNRDLYDVAHSSIQCLMDHHGAQVFECRTAIGKLLRVLAYTERDAKETAGNYVEEKL